VASSLEDAESIPPRHSRRRCSDCETPCRLTKKNRDAMYAKQQRGKRHQLALVMIACCIAAPRTFAQAGHAGFHLRIGLILPAGGTEAARSASIARGVRLGAAEANQTAALFGDHVDLLEAAGSGTGAIAAAKRLLAAGQVEILVGTTASDADAISRFAESRRVIFLDAASRSQALRSLCRRYTFFVEATDAMYANAARLGERRASGSADSRGRAPIGQNDSVVLWSPALERFGASQLNQRFMTRYGVGMDGRAWAGWAAVKIAADAALRTTSVQPARLLAYLESPTTEFDGHKGWQLTFRSADHQLRQPLYMVVAQARGGSTSPVVRDVPELHALPEQAGAENGPRPSDRVLDALIASPDARSCKRGGG
jgi:ABC-type branched-subunit amino acid transport system substrate-binding protein